ncbi:MAG: energy transducer TonB [Bacteroidota bacterium]
MAKNRSSFVAKPVYPGGLEAMRKFLAKHLKYPEKAKAANVSGTVTIRYSLDYRGKVVDAKVKKGLGFGCDEEAVRVVKMMRFRVPQDRKKKVRIHQDINIHFNLPQPSPASSPTTAPAAAPTPPTHSAPAVKITYVAKPKEQVKNTPAPKPAKPSYGYTIKW